MRLLVIVKKLFNLKPDTMAHWPRRVEELVDGRHAILLYGDSLR